MNKVRYPQLHRILSSMYEFKLVVQYSNGELEGFAESGLSETAARDGAERKALDKIESLQEMGRTGRFLNKTEYEKLSPEKKKEIQKDWAMSLKGQGE